MINSLSIFGTSSDAGKSTLAFAITYLLHQSGIKVVPSRLKMYLTILKLQMRVEKLLYLNTLQHKL